MVLWGKTCLCCYWFIFLQGACTVHFQDLSAETIRCATIPNVLANLEQARERQSRQPESSLTPSRQTLAPSVHFYAGDWEELPTVLSVVRNDVSEVTTGMSLSFSEEDFMDGCSSQDGSIIGQDFSSRRSRKLSGSRAWERASEADQGEGGYDVILLTEIPYSVTSLKKLYLLIKKVSFLLSYIFTMRRCSVHATSVSLLKNITYSDIEHNWNTIYITKCFPHWDEVLISCFISFELFSGWPVFEASIWSGILSNKEELCWFQ